MRVVGKPEVIQLDEKSSQTFASAVEIRVLRNMPSTLAARLQLS